jgi:hypothetical protein
MIRTIALLAGLTVVATVPAGFDAADFLRTACDFDAGDLEKLERRSVVVEGLKADPDEVAICGAVNLAAPATFYVDRFRQIETFKKTAEVIAIGRFSAPPTPADLAGLPLEPGEVKDLRDCRARDCDIKLDAAGIGRMAAVGRREPDTVPVTAFRDHLAGYAARYMSQGNAALMAYADGDRPAPVLAELHQIVRAAPYLGRDWPALQRALASFDGRPDPGIEHFLYWSKEAFGRKPVISITHALIAPPRAQVTAIATKQIYASHYFNASLGLTLLAETAPGRTTVIYVNRSRVDAFRGLLGPLARRLVRSRAHGGAERMLGALRARLEREYVEGR